MHCTGVGRRNGLCISRELGMLCNAGVAVPLLVLERQGFVSSCHLASEPHYRAQGGKKGTVECQHAGVTSLRCCRSSCFLQWMSWSHIRLQSRTLLKLPMNLGGLR